MDETIHIKSMPENMSVGSYLTDRLNAFGTHHFFAVPGDYNMNLLDEMSRSGTMEIVGCCNELNAGYAADGYARISGTVGVVAGMY